MLCAVCICIYVYINTNISRIIFDKFRDTPCVIDHCDLKEFEILRLYCSPVSDMSPLASSFLQYRTTSQYYGIQ